MNRIILAAAVVVMFCGNFWAGEIKFIIVRRVGDLYEGSYSGFGYSSLEAAKIDAKTGDCLVDLTTGRVSRFKVFVGRTVTIEDFPPESAQPWRDPVTGRSK